MRIWTKDFSLMWIHWKMGSGKWEKERVIGPWKIVFPMCVSIILPNRFCSLYTSQHTGKLINIFIFSTTTVNSFLFRNVLTSMYLSQAKLFNCNQILGQVADQNYTAIPKSYNVKKWLLFRPAHWTFKWHVACSFGHVLCVSKCNAVTFSHLQLFLKHAAVRL